MHCCPMLSGGCFFSNSMFSLFSNIVDLLFCLYFFFFGTIIYFFFLVYTLFSWFTIFPLDQHILTVLHLSCCLARLLHLNSTCRCLIQWLFLTLVVRCRTPPGLIYPFCGMATSLRTMWIFTGPNYHFIPRVRSMMFLFTMVLLEMVFLVMVLLMTDLSIMVQSSPMSRYKTS